MHRMSWAAWGLSLAGLAGFAGGLAACADARDADQDLVSHAPSVVLGADGVGVDAADTACALVLRSVGRVDNGTGGYATGASGLYTWDGIIAANPAVVGDQKIEVLYQTTMAPNAWYIAPATRVAAEQYTFRIDDHTPSPGMSTTSLSRTVIRLIPYIVGADGGRLFDHNRVADVFATYTLDSQNGWRIAATDAPGANACVAATPATTPRWTFAYPAWEPTLVGGPARAGGAVTVAYDGRRLRETQGCMGSHGSASATTLFVGWMFDGNEDHSGSAQVERYVVASGIGCSGPTSPCVTDEVTSPEIAIPADARGLDVWFWCQPGFDSAPNVHYDSNQGSNYHLAVTNDARAVDWAGGWNIYRARPSDTIALAEPYLYGGYTNMGLAMQAEIYVAGVTDVATIDTQKLQAWIESDALACTPGGTPTRERLSLHQNRGGPYGNNAIFQWGFESLMGRCPKGEYRFRFVFSADGGLTTTTLGTAAEATPGAPDSSWRTFRFQ